MKALKLVLSTMIAGMFSLIAGAVFGTGVGVVAFLGALFAGDMTKAMSLNMAVTPEIWTKDIEGNLFKDNEFLLKSIDESQYVVGGTVVHIPQAGSPSGAKRNRTSLPASISKRVDVDVTYPLDEITTDPRLITNAETVELSYDKRASVLMEDQRYINELVADSMLSNWKPKFFIKASGKAGAENLIYGTGTRTGIKYDDFVKAKTIFNKWNMPKQGRYVILNTEMYRSLCDDVKSLASEHITAVYDPVTGQLTKLEGFTIFERSTVLLASAVSGFKSVKNTPYLEDGETSSLYSVEDYLDIEAGTKTAADTSCGVGLFWCDIAVSRAVGQTKMFDDTGNPTYYGDIYSFLVRCGGRARRGDGKGVLGILQDIGEQTNGEQGSPSQGGNQ